MTLKTKLHQKPLHLTRQRQFVGRHVETGVLKENVRIELLVHVSDMRRGSLQVVTLAGPESGCLEELLGVADKTPPHKTKGRTQIQHHNVDTRRGRTPTLRSKPLSGQPGLAIVLLNSKSLGANAAAICLPPLLSGHDSIFQPACTRTEGVALFLASAELPTRGCQEKRHALLQP